MEFAVVLLVLAVILLWLASRSSRRRKQEAAQALTSAHAPAAAPVASPPTTSRAQQRETVTLRVFELWGSRYPDFEVVGEAYRRDSFRKLYKKRSLAPGQEFHGEAALIPERGNKHDVNAVRVDVDEIEVGYLPREDAERYRPVLDDLLRRGLAAVTPARIWATNNDGTWRARVTIALSDPSVIVPANEPPDGQVIELPANSRQGLPPVWGSAPGLVDT